MCTVKNIAGLTSRPTKKFVYDITMDKTKQNEEASNALVVCYRVFENAAQTVCGNALTNMNVVGSEIGRIINCGGGSGSGGGWG